MTGHLEKTILKIYIFCIQSYDNTRFHSLILGTYAAK